MSLNNIVTYFQSRLTPPSHTKSPQSLSSLGFNTSRLHSPFQHEQIKSTNRSKIGGKSEKIGDQKVNKVELRAGEGQGNEWD